MLGTMVRVVETAYWSSEGGPAESHQESVDAVVAEQLRSGMGVLTAQTTTNVSPAVDRRDGEDHRYSEITTIVFAPVRKGV